MRQRVADHLGLLVDFLGHEMAIAALVDQQGAGDRFHLLARDLATLQIENLAPLARQHRPVAVLQIGDPVRERGERDGVGAEEHLALAVADRERRPLAGADHQVLVASEDQRQRERAAQPLQRGARRLDR